MNASNEILATTDTGTDLSDSDPGPGTIAWVPHTPTHKRLIDIVGFTNSIQVNIELQQKQRDMLVLRQCGDSTVHEVHLRNLNEFCLTS